PRRRRSRRRRRLEPGERLGEAFVEGLLTGYDGAGRGRERIQIDLGAYPYTPSATVVVTIPSHMRTCTACGVPPAASNAAPVRLSLSVTVPAPGAPSAPVVPPVEHPQATD